VLTNIAMIDLGYKVVVEDVGQDVNVDNRRQHTLDLNVGLRGRFHLIQIQA